jgi:outer membrane beta-barrel protein
MKSLSLWTTVGCLLGLSLFNPAQAQEESTAPDPDVQSIESVLEKNVPEGAPKVELNLQVKKPQNKIDYSQIENARNLQDTVIIQKTYMPKTERFQIFGGLTYAVNDAFFRNMGGQLRVGYHFNEKWGVEATTFFLTSTETAEKKNFSNQRMELENLITPSSMLGANVYFSSIYGKMALEDRKIIPFEFYQTLGVGQINTKPTSNATSVYFGLGDIFSISKNSEIRADLSWFFYNGKTIKGDTQSANTIFLTIGYGRFVPEARSR